MAKKNFLQVLEGLFSKVDTTESSYEKALEEKEEQLIILQADYQEKQKMVSLMHRDVLKGLLGDKQYKKEKAFLEELAGVLQELKKEIQLIREYKTDDVLNIIEEIDAVSKKNLAEHQSEIEKIKLELMQSKLVYFKAMAKAREKYNAIVSPTRKLDALQIQFGIKKNSYVSGSHDALNVYALSNGGHEFLPVQQYDVYQALEYGKTPEQLNKLVQAGKDKGLLEN
jgi:hypothetical protein